MRSRVSWETMIKLPSLPRWSFPWLKALDLKHEGTSDWRIRKLVSPQDLQRLLHFLQEPPRGYTAELYSSSALLTEKWNITKRSRSKLTILMCLPAGICISIIDQEPEVGLPHSVNLRNLCSRPWRVTHRHLTPFSTARYCDIINRGKSTTRPENSKLAGTISISTCC
jgi:hypothetical protein